MRYSDVVEHQEESSLDIERFRQNGRPSKQETGCINMKEFMLKKGAGGRESLDTTAGDNNRELLILDQNDEQDVPISSITIGKLSTVINSFAHKATDPNQNNCKAVIEKVQAFIKADKESEIRFKSTIKALK